MSAKPAFLGPDRAIVFQDPDVAQAYHCRPPYPAEVFDVLRSLIVDEPRAVLDLGCGAGALARRLLPHVERIDAVDFSAAMVEEGKRLPGGDDARLRWIVAPAEEAPLRPPYALAMAGASLHWMDWEIVLPRIAQALTPRGALAIVEDGALPPPWPNELRQIIVRYSTNQDYQPNFDLPAELERRGLFRIQGQRKTASVPFEQSVAEYVESFHGRQSLSRQQMGAGAAAFDAEVRALVAAHCPDGVVRLELVSPITWGRPQAVDGSRSAGFP